MTRHILYFLSIIILRWILFVSVNGGRREGRGERVRVNGVYINAGKRIDFLPACQCCGSGMFFPIPDPTFPSRIPDPNFFDRGSASKNLSISTPKSVSKL
jgi:hypothetical protein